MVEQQHRAGPVFVHSSFRTSSTWLWTRFRASPDALAFFEFFHEVFAHPGTTKLRDISYDSWDSGHPAAAPYNLEYAPLLEETGCVSGFAPDMAFDLFMPAAPDRSITPAEAAYVSGLIDLARRLERVPVLTCVRTLGRVHGLRRQFGGTHILWYRNLFRQWCSYSAQAIAGNPYFFDRTNEILAAGRHDRFVDALLDILPLDVGGTAPESTENFQRFILFHLYLYALALPDCDLVASVDDLAADPQSRDAFAATVAAATGIVLDLGSLATSIGFQSMPLAKRGDVVEGVRIIANTLPLYIAEWSERQAAFVTRLIDEMAAEMDRYAFYTERLTRHAVGGRPGLARAKAS